jgi:hypothetical protein
MEPPFTTKACKPGRTHKTHRQLSVLLASASASSTNNHPLHHDGSNCRTILKSGASPWNDLCVRRIYYCSAAGLLTRHG